MNKITCTTSETTVKGEVFHFVETSDKRLLIYKVKAAPFLAGPSEMEIRDQAIIQMREDGFSLQVVGAAYGLSQVRISQISSKRMKAGK